MPVKSIKLYESMEATLMTEQSKLTEIPAHITHVPHGEPFVLSPNSIIVEDSGTEYLIGEDAQAEKPDSVRQFGGSLSSPQYRRLLKGALAKTLGEGKQKLSVALSAPHHHIDKFRAGPSKFHLSQEASDLFTETVRTIKFKTGRSDSEWKTLELIPDGDIKVKFEYQAVVQAIPKGVNSFILWQIGYGDWQQTALVEKRVMKDACMRLEGLSGAVKLFAKRTGLAFGDACIAWETEEMPDSAHMDGLNGKKMSCKATKEQCLRHWIGAATGDLFPTVEQWRSRLTNLIVSGGLTKDETFWRILNEEVLGQGMKLWKINELPESFKGRELCEDPSFTCVQGLLKNAELALDLGNGRLKTGLRLDN